MRRAATVRSGRVRPSDHAATVGRPPPLPVDWATQRAPCASVGWEDARFVQPWEQIRVTPYVLPPALRARRPPLRPGRLPRPAAAGDEPARHAAAGLRRDRQLRRGRRVGRGPGRRQRGRCSGGRQPGRPGRPAPCGPRPVAGRRRRVGHPGVPVHRRYAVAGPGRRRRGHRPGAPPGRAPGPGPLEADHPGRGPRPASPRRRGVLLRGRRRRGVVRPRPSPRRRTRGGGGAGRGPGRGRRRPGGLRQPLRRARERRADPAPARRAAARRGPAAHPDPDHPRGGPAGHRGRVRLRPDRDLGAGHRSRRARDDRVAARAPRGRQRDRRPGRDRPPVLLRLRAPDAPVRRPVAGALPAPAAGRLPRRPRRGAAGPGPGRRAVHDQRLHPRRADHPRAAHRWRDDGPGRDHRPGLRHRVRRRRAPGRLGRAHPGVRRHRGRGGAGHGRRHVRGAHPAGPAGGDAHRTASRSWSTPDTARVPAARPTIGP